MIYSDLSELRLHNTIIKIRDLPISEKNSTSSR